MVHFIFMTHLFCHWKFIPLNLPHLFFFLPLLPLTLENMFVLCLYILLCWFFFFLDSTCKWRNVNAHTVLVFFWLISLSTLPSSMNKSSGGDRIPAELFKILNDDAVKVLHSVCQQIWKDQQWSQDWKKSVFIPVPKEGNAKECSNYRILVLISRASKVMLKILQAWLQ